MQVKELNVDIFTLLDKRWALLCAGRKDNCNAMTVSWGGMGTIWNKPTVTVYVRHSRFTYPLMEENDVFTLSFFPEEYKKDLAVMGKISGRDGDKLQQTSLTYLPLAQGVGFAQAELTLVCKKMFAQDLDVQLMDEERRKAFYPTGDIHRMYLAEVIDVIQK